VDTLTVCNWENNRTSPRLYLLPRIYDFLGNSPFSRNTTTLGERIKEYRCKNGLSLRKLAKIIGVDPETIARWEKERVEPRGKLKKRLSSLLRNLPR
jgi:DNA-binding XRE family transcriptional regulator